MRFVFVLALAVAFTTAQAQVLSPKGVELELSFEAQFILEEGQENDPREAASSHSEYLLGVLKSERLGKKLGVNFERSEGFAAPRFPLSLRSLKTRRLPDGRSELSYRYRAKSLVHKNAAAKMARTGSFEIVLPYDLSAVYDKNCTDSHYDSFDDYWYFWDPFRKGCEKLLQEPATRNVLVKVKTLDYKHIENNTRFDLLRGNNGNGRLLQIDMITGFDSSPRRRDLGWKIFRNLNTSLERKFGFTLIEKSGSPKSPLHIFELEQASGVIVRLRHQLVDTAIESRSMEFARFFRESVRDADVIVYSGHSGLGGNLDIPSLQEKAGPFEFNPKKRQVFYFNSCSSYTYYLDHFRSEKTKARIDVLTNALAAYMDEDSHETLSFLESVLDDESHSPTWIDVMERMEASNPWDMTYLLNVGGV